METGQTTVHNINLDSAQQSGSIWIIIFKLNIMGE